MQKQVLFLIPGLLGIMAATYVYPLLHGNLLLATCLVVFALPILLHIVLGVRHRLSANYGLLRKAYTFAAISAALFAALFYLNGALDKSRVAQIRSVVVRRSVSHGHTGTVCSLFVSSWRPGRSEERVEVSERVFGSSAQGSRSSSMFIRVSWGFPGSAVSTGSNPPLSKYHKTLDGDQSVAWQERTDLPLPTRDLETRLASVTILIDPAKTCVRLRLSRTLLHHAPSISVVAQSGEFRVPEMIALCPL